MQPAEVEDVILCQMLGKVIVLVREDQLSLAIGKFGQNVRLASKLVGWDINVMTQALLDQQLDKSIEAFCVVPGVTADLAENLVSQGFFTFDDLSVIEPDQLVEMSGLSAEECDRIVEYADVESARLEVEERIANEQRRSAANQPEAAPPKATTPPLEEDSGGEKNIEAAVEKEITNSESDEGKQVETVAGQEETIQVVVETVPPGTEDQSSVVSEES